MKKIGALFLIVVSISLMVSCDDLTGGSTEQPSNPANPTEPTEPTEPTKPTEPNPPESVDPAFWFGDIHEALIARIGVVRVDDDGTFLDDTSGIDMGQIVNSQYVCNAINAKWGTSYVPVSGTASQMANCEYLLKMIDKANANATSYGTSAYATKQVLDKAAVDKAVQTLWVPRSKFVAVAYNTDKAAYSTDGINWTAATLPSSSKWNYVTYGGE